MVNGGKSELAVAGGHGGEEVFEFAAEFLRLLAVDLDRFPEEVVGEQPDAVGEEAKHELHDEAGYGLVVFVALAQIVFELCKLLRCLLCYTNLERTGFELFGFLKDGTEDIERRQIGAWNWSGEDQIVKRELVDDWRSVGEVGVNFEVDKVADHKQRGIFKILAILEQLHVCGF